MVALSGPGFGDLKPPIDRATGLRRGVLLVRQAISWGGGLRSAVDLFGSDLVAVVVGLSAPDDRWAALVMSRVERVGGWWADREAPVAAVVVRRDRP